MAFLMMFPLMAFEALPLRSHASYFLIEHIKNAASLDCFASSPRILFRVFSTESLWISAIMPASVEDETISDNICAPDSSQGHSFFRGGRVNGAERNIPG